MADFRHVLQGGTACHARFDSLAFATVTLVVSTLKKISLIACLPTSLDEVSVEDRGFVPHCKRIINAYHARSPFLEEVAELRLQCIVHHTDTTAVLTVKVRLGPSLLRLVP